MKSVGILTFHASHNYGSMLQAYALQQVVKQLGFHCEIINFRKKEQKAMYAPIHKKGSVLQRMVRTVTLLPYLKDCNRKFQLFEDFMKNRMILSKKEYATLAEVDADNLSYDFYITGSDQIWNPICTDFDWVYFLPFVKSGKKISYAPSMGAICDSIRDVFNQRFTEFSPKMGKLINAYDALSVREVGTCEKIKSLTNKDVQVVLDPTLLLSAQKWGELIAPQPMVKGDYIFLYSPVFNLPTFEMVRKIAKKLNLKVVVSQLYGREITYKYKDFEIHAGAGPEEFLNLVKNARMVCGCSFHVIVFSILLKVPFLAINGIYDNRISNLLKKTGLENRSISKHNFDEVLKNAYNIDFDGAYKMLEPERKQSQDFLEKALS